jgi:hypothetical protein
MAASSFGSLYNAQYGSNPYAPTGGGNQYAPLSGGMAGQFGGGGGMLGNQVPFNQSPLVQTTQYPAASPAAQQPSAPASQQGIGPNLNVSGSYNLPTSSYLPFPNAAQNQQMTNTQVSGNLADNDLRNLAKQYLPAANAGVSTDYRNSPGMMANLLGPRSQAASQNELSMVQNPYSFNNANFGANLGLQGAQANEAFGLGQIGQNIYQTGQASQLSNIGSLLGLFQNLFGGMTGAMGSMTNGLLGGTVDSGSLDLGSLLGMLGGAPDGSATPTAPPASGQGAFGPGFLGGFFTGQQ